ncbi:50S ribosomal protein L25/general stress protein Ctc [Peijinzhouia sedimentorum]|tara:strand:- start:317 stop:892 length:576 start_codon:yes stop_codon:yes gene_type:complete
MKSIEIIGFKRANLGKTEAKQLRLDGNVPCVLYGGDSQIHFHTPAILFRELVYTPEVHLVKLNVEGDLYEAVLQDIQFHPVSEMILHADFLLLKAGKIVKIDIPVKLTGTAPGVIKGGKLQIKLKAMKVKGLPKDLPDFIPVDVSKLDLGKSVKVGEVEVKDLEVLTNSLVTIATVEIPRALKGKKGDTEE